MASEKMQQRVLFFLTLSLATAWPLFAPAQNLPASPAGQRIEITFSPDALPAGPADLVDFSVSFTSPKGSTFEIPGFWDGKNQFKVRFRPTEEGQWKYSTRSNPKVNGLDGLQGEWQCGKNYSLNPWNKHGILKVNGTHLEHQDGTPFFWMGDTVWNGPLLSSDADWETYLKDRKAKEFSVIQFNVLAPWRAGEADEKGNQAFTSGGPMRINPVFFQRLDKRMQAIETAGMAAAPVLVWSLTKKDPGQFLSNEDILRLVRYQVARYESFPVVWILAGDNPYNPQQTEKWKKIGREVFARGHHAPVTTHPTGMNWPWESWRNEKWLSLFGYQSGHGDDARTLKWIHSGPVTASVHKGADRPIINLEPPYEDHVAYQSKKPHSDFSVRRAIYWSLFAAPVAGVTYGGHGMWSWQMKPGVPLDHPGTGRAQPWHIAKDLPGALQMKYLARLMKSFEWWKLQPAPLLLIEQPGNQNPARHISVMQASDNSGVLAYLPEGGNVRLRPAINNPASQEWHNPLTGEKKKATQQGGVYQAPDNQDWILCIRGAVNP